MSYKKGQHLQRAIGKFTQQLEAVISVGCQQKLAHRLDDSAATFFVAIQIVPIHFVAVFHVGLFCEGLQLLCLAAFF